MFLNEPELIFYTQLNGFMYCDLTRIILFTFYVLFLLLNGFKYSYEGATI